MASTDIVIAEMYAPNEQELFWDMLSSYFTFTKNQRILILGDFNAMDNPKWDKSSLTQTISFPETFHNLVIH